MNEPTDLERIIPEFLRYKQEVKGNKYRTLKTYADHLRVFKRDFEGRDLSQVPWEDVMAWIKKPERNGSAPEPGTIRNRTVYTTNFYKYLRDVERIDFTRKAAVAAEFTAKKVRPKKEKFVRDAPWLSLYGLPWTEPDLELPPHLWPGLERTDVVWLGLGFYWGFRAIEIMSIRPEEISPEFFLDFERKGEEGTNRHQFDGLKVIEEDYCYLNTIGDPGRFLECLDWLRKEREGERFLMPATKGQNVEVNGPDMPAEWIATDRDTQWLNRRLDIILRNNGLDRKLFTPHWLRSSTATNLARSGASVEHITDIMNHRDYNTSMIYINLREFQDERARNIRRRQIRAAKLAAQDLEDEES